MSRERPGNVLSESGQEHQSTGGTPAVDGEVGPSDPTAAADDTSCDPDAEAEAFVRFCYRRRAVAWPELYDEMCAVAARAEYRGMDYEELQRLGIGFALAALPRMAELADRVIAQERRPRSIPAVA